MTPATLRAIQTDPAAFRRALLIDTAAGPWPLESILDPWQRDDFTALDPGWLVVTGQSLKRPFPQVLDGEEVESGDPNGSPDNSTSARAAARLRAYLERPRGHSKTADLAVMVSWALVASRRRLSGVAAAADMDQARLLRDAVARLLSDNSWLGQFLTVGRDRIENPHTGSELVILSSDASSSYGLTPDVVICDELTHWAKRDLWDSLISAAAKKPTCAVVVISNAGRGRGESWQWLVRESCRTDPDWYFHSLDGSVASWISPKALAEQRRLLPELVYERLWLNRWTTGSGDAIRPGDLEAAITLDGPSGPEPGWAYVAGLDLGITRDATALAIVGRHVGWREQIVTPPPRPGLTTADTLRDAGVWPMPVADRREVVHAGTYRYRLCEQRAWEPERGHRVDLDAVESAVIEAHRRFRFAAVAVDPYQAEQMAQRLTRAGVPVELTPFSAANLRSMATATLEAFSERLIDLWRDPRLLSEFGSTTLSESQYGYRLSFARDERGHGDRATAVVLALHAARRLTGVARLTRPIIGWPMAGDRPARYVESLAGGEMPDTYRREWWRD